MYTPVNPNFTIQNWGARGYKSHGDVILMHNGTILTFLFIFFLFFPVDLTGQLHSLKDGDRKKNEEEINVTTPDPLDRTIEENFLTNRLDPPTYEEATCTASAAWSPYSFNTNL